MKLLFVATALIAFMITNVYGANWVLMFRNDDKEYYVDSESVVKKNGVIEAWIMIDSTKNESINNNNYKSVIRLWSLDRENRKINI